MDTLSKRGKRLAFIAVVSSSIMSVISIGLLNTAFASTTDGDILLQIPKSYHKIFGLTKGQDWDDAIERQTKEARANVGYFHDKFANVNLQRHDDIGQQTNNAYALRLYDSKGNVYDLILPENEKWNEISKSSSQLQYLKSSNGEVVSVVDYSRYVQSNEKFSKLADAIYLNSETEYEFIHEIRYVVTQATEYRPDEIDEAALPFETLSKGTGDCEDLTILIASLLASSSHTKDWEIEVVYFDAHNVADSSTPNHVALFIRTSDFSTFLETTNPSANGSNVWKTVSGWYIEIPTREMNPAIQNS